MDEDYYISRGGQIPVKWTAPEVVHLSHVIFLIIAVFVGCSLSEVFQCQ